MARTHRAPNAPTIPRTVRSRPALNGCGCFRLASRINDLRNAGHPIETKTLELPNGKHIAQYHLKERTATC